MNTAYTGPRVSGFGGGGFYHNTAISDSASRTSEYQEHEATLAALLTNLQQMSFNTFDRV